LMSDTKSSLQIIVTVSLGFFKFNDKKTGDFNEYCS
jgi:hypothetical protein